MLTYAHVCSRMLAYADVCLMSVGAMPLKLVFHWIVFAFAGYLDVDQVTYADTYADADVC